VEWLLLFHSNLPNPAHSWKYVPQFGYYRSVHLCQRTSFLSYLFLAPLRPDPLSLRFPSFLSFLSRLLHLLVHSFQTSLCQMSPPLHLQKFATAPSAPAIHQNLYRLLPARIDSRCCYHSISNFPQPSI